MKRTILILALLSFISISNAQETTTETPAIDKNSWGLGFGIPYGVLGGNIDVNVAENLNISAGLGTTVLAGIGYNVGLKYFFSSFENTMRPRVLAFYGVNTLSSIGNQEESYTGLSIGGGIQWMWGSTKSNGLDVDIIFVATSSYDGDEDYGKMKLSIGYRHSF